MVKSPNSCSISRLDVAIKEVVALAAERVGSTSAEECVVISVLGVGRVGGVGEWAVAGGD